MLSTKEKQLIKIIRYSPIILVGIICFVLTYFLLSQNNRNYKKESENIKKEYISSNKKRVQNEVNRVIEYINYEKSNSEQKLRKLLKDRVYEAHSIADSIYKKYQYSKSKKEILELIGTALRALRFNNGRGYFYINSLKGVSLMHPIEPKFEGTNNINIKDSRGNYVLRKILNGLKKSDDYFAEIYWNKPSDLSHEYKKITFNKRFAPYDVFIGTGEYLENFENNLKAKMLKYISTITYDKNGYIFIFDYEGYQLSHIKSAYIGLNRLYAQDKEGKYFIKEVIDMAKQGEGFVTYMGTIKPDTGKGAQKTSFVKGLPDFKWAIGSGFYVEELNKTILLKEVELTQENKEYIIQLLISSVILSSVFLILSIYFAKDLEERFFDYRKRVVKEIDKNRKKDTMLAQQSKMAAMGEMLANIAHQWRQPLSLVSTAASGMKIKKQMQLLEEEEFYESMDMINESVQHLSQTIDDFSDYFNPNKKKEPFCLTHTFEKAFNLIHKQLKDYDIQVVQSYEDIRINGYENELLQVLINVLNNAKDELMKKVTDKFIFVEAYKEDSFLVINIKDNAFGISKEIKDRIFEPYFTTKHKKSGTGIGLYMCREIIVKHMNGTIEAKNVSFEHEGQVFHGAKFVIQIPL